MLETLTIKEIMGIKPKPCYNPVGMGYMEPDWEGTIIDFLKIEKIPPRDRLWVACSGGFIDDKILRLFAVWCARGALKTINNPDPRSVKACDIAEAYAHGKATKEELEEAHITAWNTHWAAYRAAYCAAYLATDKAAYWAAHWAAYWKTNEIKESKKQVEKLIDMMERKEPK